MVLYLTSSRACKCATCGAAIPKGKAHYADDDFEDFCDAYCASIDPCETGRQRFARLERAELLAMLSKRGQPCKA